MHIFPPKKCNGLIVEKFWVLLSVRLVEFSFKHLSYLIIQQLSCLKQANIFHKNM